jgi:hypothetical protein
LLIVEVEMTLINEKAFDLEERLIELAVRVITVVEALPDTKAGRHIAGQLVRAGTAPQPTMGKHRAPNHGETSSTK